MTCLVNQDDDIHPEEPNEEGHEDRDVVAALAVLDVQMPKGLEVNESDFYLQCNEPKWVEMNIKSTPHFTKSDSLNVVKQMIDILIMHSLHIHPVNSNSNPL